MKSVLINPPFNPVHTAIRLAASKSESNRALIMNALSGFKGQLFNIAEARDSQTMQRLLHSSDQEADVIDAGTTMRFLTAYFATGGQKKIMTGTPRMCQRPIGILVDALKSVGAQITYLKETGYPPLKLEGFSYSGNNKVTIKGNVSSQYVSALLMIAPTLPDGLELHISGEIGSKPYIEMTLQQMTEFGISYQADWTTQIITVPHQTYTPSDYHIESDWSGASYWYSIVALLPEAEIELLGLKENSYQGDSEIVRIMQHLGVTSTFTPNGVLLKKGPVSPKLEWDFTGCPDLAQTVAVCAAIKGVPLEMTGVESLKIKETDRILALQTELQKLGFDLVEVEVNHRYELQKRHSFPKGLVPVIETYDDHRMAMAFAPVGMVHPILIEDPSVVIKSYPSFWDHLGGITEIKEDAVYN